MILFNVRKIANNKQTLTEALREALMEYATEQNARAAFGKLSRSVDNLVEAFPSLNGRNLHVIVQGTFETEAFGQVTVSVETLSENVMA